MYTYTRIIMVLYFSTIYGNLQLLTQVLHRMLNTFDRTLRNRLGVHVWGVAVKLVVLALATQLVAPGVVVPIAGEVVEGRGLPLEGGC